MRLHQTIAAQGIPATLQAVNTNLQKITTITMLREEAIDLNLALAKCLRIRLILAQSQGKSPSDTLDLIAREILPFTDGPAAPAVGNEPQPTPETDPPTAEPPSAGPEPAPEQQAEDTPAASAEQEQTE